MKSFQHFLTESNDLKAHVRMIASRAKILKNPALRHPAILLRDHGRSYSFDDTSFAGKRGARHGCYMNAGRLALNNSTYTYVEGYVSVHGVPIEHAWVVDKNHVIDPTITSTKGIQGYYGLPIKTDYLRRVVLKTKVWGVLVVMTNPDILTDDPKEIVAR